MRYSPTTMNVTRRPHNPSNIPCEWSFFDKPISQSRTTASRCQKNDTHFDMPNQQTVFIGIRIMCLDVFGLCLFTFVKTVGVAHIQMRNVVCGGAICIASHSIAILCDTRSYRKRRRRHPPGWLPANNKRGIQSQKYILHSHTRPIPRHRKRLNLLR